LAAEFKAIFRLSESRFRVLMADIQALKHQFFQNTKSLNKADQAFEAKLPLPIKTLAYGVPTHTFIDYFQITRVYFQILEKCSTS
jgi:hypothetical protein